MNSADPVVSLANAVCAARGLGRRRAYTRLFLVTPAVLLGGVTVGCSADPVPPHVPGALIAGTATVAVDHQPGVNTQDVSCQFMPGFTIVTIGDGGTGATAYISNQSDLTAQMVTIRNIGGFTGTFTASRGPGVASIEMTGSTYTINGAARGLYTAHPRTTEMGSFLINVAC